MPRERAAATTSKTAPAPAVAMRREWAGTFPELESAPVVLNLDEVAAIYRCSVGHLRRKLPRGQFKPIPAFRNPYRWLKDDIAADLAQRAAAARQRSNDIDDARRRTARRRRSPQ